MFSVEYATLREVMRQFLYTGVFRAVVTDPRLFSAEGQIELHVKEGVAIACRFVTRQGEVFSLDRWDEQLGRVGVLNWELTTSSDVIAQRTSSASLPVVRPTSDTLPSRQPARPPRQRITLLPAQLRQLPMRHRQVYSLIDGKRQAADIALLLYKPQHEIGQILEELERQGLIL